ncbi:MAG: dihydrofolate reductase family protein [Bacteroidales bacterium]
MKAILVFVSTLDGKITKWGDPFVRSWSSKSDQEYFTGIMENSTPVIVGSNTFNADPLKASDRRLIVVMTRYPSQYKRYEVPGQIEFTDESPGSLVSRFEMQGHKQITVVGGPKIAVSFLKSKLIDELWLTIEPKIFGTGGSFVTEQKLDIELKLLTCDKVNDSGTLITKYAITKYNDI